jgi:hypothetical protein
MDLIYEAGEMGWMTGIIAVGIVFGILALVYSKGEKK